MGLSEVAAPAIGMFSSGAGKLAGYAWVLFIFVGIAIAIAIVVLLKMRKAKNAQWTHKLVIRRVLNNNLLSKPFTHRMRRFPLIKRAEVFELEKPVLGGYLMPELNEYSDINEFSIIIDKNNRILVNRGEYFDPDKNYVNVSAKHAEIDISRADLRADYQNVLSTTKRIEWAQIAKYAFLSLLIISVMIVSIIAIGEWGEAQKSKATIENAQASAMTNLAEAMETSQATVNTQVLILDKLKELYGTNNIRGIVKEKNNETD